MAQIALPDWLEPMAATLTHERFNGPEWIFERKLDAIGVLTFRHGRPVRLLSRNGLPRPHPAIEAAVMALPAREVILDGEVVWGGRQLLPRVRRPLARRRALASRPLHERRTLLARLPLEAPLARLHLAAR